MRVVFVESFLIVGNVACWLGVAGVVLGSKLSNALLSSVSGLLLVGLAVLVHVA